VEVLYFQRIVSKRYEIRVEIPSICYYYVLNSSRVFFLRCLMNDNA
jgi:hypothetical protein